MTMSGRAAVMSPSCSLLPSSPFFFSNFLFFSLFTSVPMGTGGNDEVGKVGIQFFSSLHFFSFLFSRSGFLSFADSAVYEGDG